MAVVAAPWYKQTEEERVVALPLSPTVGVILSGGRPWILRKMPLDCSSSVWRMSERKDRQHNTAIVDPHTCRAGSTDPTFHPTHRLAGVVEAEDEDVHLRLGEDVLEEARQQRELREGKERKAW